jgi:hypothetical protein
MGLLAVGEWWAEIYSTGYEHTRSKEASQTHTTEVPKAILKFAAPFFAWEWRGHLYILCGFGEGLDSGLSRLWKAVSVRIVDVLDVG